MSSRTYLSIGDVLTLLREEFPDVTISKIRFLESQGLVNPERSPSGYRKFFDHDVERLRWVLRQQREHFLPLKVIRDRLADGNLEAGEVPAEPHNGAAAGRARHAATTSPGGSAEPEKPTRADEEAMARILADASRRSARLPDDASAHRGLQVVTGAVQSDVPEGTRVSASASGAVAPGPVGSPAGTSARGSAEKGKGAPAARPGAASAGTPSGAGGRSRSRAADGESGGPDTASVSAPSVAPESAATGGPGSARSGAASGGVTATVTGASLTLQELCAASGLTGEEVAGLQSFGLIESAVVAGIETFDEDALTVANLAASFAMYGIEPRHLRLFRNAVDRELGLIEQVVIPLLRQRNPEARHRAGEAATDLAALGQSMRASLLALALKRHLGG